MGIAVTVKNGIFFTKASVALACTWPPSIGAGKTRVLIFNVLWHALFVNLILLLLPMFYAIYDEHADPNILGHTVCLTSAVIQIAVKMIVSRIQRKRFQMLNENMEVFCKNADAYEMKVLQRYVDKMKYIHAGFTVWSYFTSAVVISGPLFLPQTFPTYAKYPFHVERQPLKSIIYIQQSLVGFQASSGVAVDCQVALLLWYVIGRFEILAMRLENVTCDRELHWCIKTHCELLSYTRKLTVTVRLPVLTTIIATAAGAAFGALNLVSSQPLMLKGVFVITILTAETALFISAYPADNLIQMSERISSAIYGSRWFEKSINMQRKVPHIILRSQRCETIRIPGIFSQLSLRYYAVFLYRIFSYFTAIRVMMAGDHFDQSYSSAE